MCACLAPAGLSSRVLKWLTSALVSSTTLAADIVGERADGSSTKPLPLASTITSHVALSHLATKT
eukprot:scaffold274799_cov24-Prasinocladus_malaysianus.AAC.1